jgi:hypothetical protein
MSRGSEQHYRRLLLAYPARHRAAHGEEMLGVLMDGAASGSRTNRLADAADLVRGGLIVRARRADAAGWGDALAVLGVVTAMLVCTLAPLGLGLLLFSAFAPTKGCLAMLAWPLAVAAGLVGLRRTTAALSVAATFALLAFGDLDGWAGPSAMLASLAAIAAAFSSDTRRGWRVLGRGRAAALVVGCALISGFLLIHAQKMTNHWREPFLSGPLQPREQVWLLLTFGLGLVFAASLRIGSRSGRRAVLLLAAPLAATTSWLLEQQMVLFDDHVGVASYGSPLGWSLAIACCAALVAEITRRLRSPSAARSQDARPDQAATERPATVRR